MNKKSWADQFVAGLRDDDGVPDYRLRGVVEGEPVRGVDPEEHALFMAGWNALAHDYHHKALEHLERLVEVVESPIEKAMLFALCVSARERTSNVRYKVNGHEFGDFTDFPDILTIEPQARLGEYRVDFLLTYREWYPSPNERHSTKSGSEVSELIESHRRLIVECDGHDYHDRSKEQASRDRTRDRELKKIGFEVFRYTGSDIWKDPVMRAREAVAHVTSNR